TCNPNFCPAGPTGPGCCLNGDAGACGYLGPSGCTPPMTTPIDPIDVGKCISNAQSRMELTCMQGPPCRCSNCPVPYETRTSIDGCRQLLACMHRFKCSNADCYKLDSCQPTIDAYGGLGQAAFTYASQVVSCDYMAGCDECPGIVPPVVDAGGPPL